MVNILPHKKRILLSRAACLAKNILLQLFGATKFKTRAHILVATNFLKVNKTSAQLRGKGKRFPPTLVVNICVVAAAPRKQVVIILDKNNLKDAIWGI